MKMIKKAFLISFIFVLIFCTTVLPTYAAVIEGVQQDTSIDFDNTDILEDLKDGLTDIEKLLSADISVISFMEYCFSEVTDIKDKYGIYFYIYNPQQRQIEVDSTADRVLMATKYDGNGNPTDWVYQDITCVDWVDDPESEWYKKLYKFKLTDASGFYSAALSNPDVRSYHVSGIELKIAGNQNATEYAVGMKYTWSGYANGCGKTMSAEKLSVKTEPIDVIELNVHMTDWLTDSSALGAYYQNQVNSVYFAVDNSILEKYGQKLQRIEAEWWEYRLNPILVTNNSNLVSYFNNNSIGHTTCPNDNVKFSLHTKLQQVSAGSNALDYGLAYNITPSATKFLSEGSINNIVICQYLENPRANTLSRTSIQQAAYDYGIKHNEQNNTIIIKDREFSKKLFDNPDAKQEVNGEEKAIYGYKHLTIDADDKIELKNYDSNHSWLDKVQDYGFIGSFVVNSDDEYNVSNAIQKITRSDISGENIADTLKIGEGEVEHFKSFVISSELEGKSVFVFRYAVSDYWARDFSFYNDNGAAAAIQNGMYRLCQNMCYLDFDIITLTFKNDAGTETILPVVMSPIDIFLSAPPAINTGVDLSGFMDMLKKIFKIILGVIVGVLVIVAIFALLSIFFSNILSGVLKGLLYILSLPFMGISLVWNWITGKGKKQKKNK